MATNAPAPRRALRNDTPRRPEPPARPVQRAGVTRTGTARVTAAYGERETVTDVIVSRRTFEEGAAIASVEVSAGGTYNLGNYESLRLDVRVTMPCLPPETSNCYELVSGIVHEKLAEEEAAWGQNRSAQEARRPQAAGRSASRRG